MVSSLLQLASLPEFFGKELPFDPQYKLSPATSLPPSCSGSFTQCLPLNCETFLTPRPGT